MQKNEVPEKQGIVIMSLFIFGSSVIIGVSTKLKQDSWIPLVVSFVLSLPILMVYSRILHLFEGQGLFEIIEVLVGKIFSKILILLLVFYAIHLGSLVLGNFAHFIALVDLPNTPHFMIIIPFIVVCVYLAACGPKVLANWSVIVGSVIVLLVFITLVSSLSVADFDNLLPVFEHDFKDFITPTLNIISFPFGEVVLFMALFSYMKKGSSSYKFFFFGSLFGCLIMLFIVLRNIVLLGPYLVSTEYFPSYIAARLINIGDFLTRIEGTISINFILAGITKITITLMVATKGICKIFSIKKERHLLFPVSLLMMAICFTSFSNMEQMFEFGEKYYVIYAIPFQLIIPLLIWIIAEIRTKFGKKPLNLQLNEA